MYHRASSHPTGSALTVTALPKICTKFLRGVSSSGSMKIRSFVNSSPMTSLRSLANTGMRLKPLLKITDSVCRINKKTQTRRRVTLQENKKTLGHIAIGGGDHYSGCEVARGEDKGYTDLKVSRSFDTCIRHSENGSRVTFNQYPSDVRKSRTGCVKKARRTPYSLETGCTYSTPLLRGVIK